SAGQNTVTGTGTNFSANSRVGDAFQGPDGRWYEVANITSATVLSILPAYQGATVAGGSYGLAPMQGYVKESADRLRQIVNDWGSTLAGLGSVSTENVVPVTKGGTGGTTPALARSGLGLKAAAVADIVGSVSQSGGVPTGAIIEQINNANGSAIKYADGTMICFGRGSGTTGTELVNQYGAGGVTYAAVSVSFPAVFANNNYSFIAKTTSRGMVELSSSRTTSACTVQVRHASANQVVDFDYIVIGRWF
ncbi:phage tail protein, partial [Pseudomonas tussilaginis]|uniref:phage tail protein n=1 Tax=Pseudomonas putida TaxID=303 RepID=UPI0023633FAF